MDESGNIFVTDRLKNIIKTKVRFDVILRHAYELTYLICSQGFQISPAELEGHILKHPYVSEVGVIGKPDEWSGEVPVAFVTLTEAGLDAAERDQEKVKNAIKDHVKASKVCTLPNLFSECGGLTYLLPLQSQYKWLGDVTILESLPKLPSGKIVARDLKALLLAAPVAVVTPIALHHTSTSSSTSSGTSTPTDAEKRGELVKAELPVFITEQARLAREKKAEQAGSKRRAIREWVSLYRIMFTIIFVVNIIGIGFTLAHKWHIGQKWCATFALAWITAGLCARSEMFLRILYETLLLLFSRWPPFWFRNAISTFLLNVGGIHSGSSVVGTLWLMTAMIEFYRKGPHWIHASILAFALITTIILVAVCASAWPAFREKYHNWFENIHRWVGWFGVFMLWIVVGLADTWVPGPHNSGHFDGSKIWHKPDIYLAMFITVVVFGPWTTYHKVSVHRHVSVSVISY